MHRTKSPSLAAAALALTACAAPVDQPASLPIVCDPAAADRIVLGYQWVNDWEELPAYQLHGRQLLVVDGSCRYHVFDARLDPRALRSGTLDAATLDDLNADLATGPFASIDGVHARDGSVDSPWLAVWRDTAGGSCEGNVGCASPETPEPLTRLIDRGAEWVTRLHALGAPATTPVRVFFIAGEHSGTVRHAWTGETDLVALLQESSHPEGVRLDGSDAALLRTLRADLGENQTLALEAGGEVWTVTVIDETPFDTERGFLRPPFDIPYAPNR